MEIGEEQETIIVVPEEAPRRAVPEEAPVEERPLVPA